VGVSSNVTAGQDNLVQTYTRVRGVLQTNTVRVALSNFLLVLKSSSPNHGVTVLNLHILPPFHHLGQYGVSTILCTLLLWLISPGKIRVTCLTVFAGGFRNQYCAQGVSETNTVPMWRNIITEGFSTNCGDYLVRMLKTQILDLALLDPLLSTYYMRL
jgi:hypothetical protein